MSRRRTFLLVVAYIGCLFVAAFLVRADKRAASEPRPVVVRRPVGDERINAYLRETIATILEGGPTGNSGLLTLLTVETVHGYSVDPASFAVKESVIGTGVYDGERLPAGIVTARLHEVNRRERKERDLCFIFVGLVDERYEYMRHIDLFECTGDRSKIDAWKKAVAFRSS